MTDTEGTGTSVRPPTQCTYYEVRFMLIKFGKFAFDASKQNLREISNRRIERSVLA